jgi:hypothetical protein
MKQINQAGVRIYETKSGGRELALDSPIDKMVMSVLAGAAEIERAKARERTRDALQRKVEHGHVAGGKCFGYENVTIFDESGRRSHVVRRVREDEAAVVRRLFELAAEGRGLRAVAKRLNDEGTLAPTPRRQGGPRGWAPSSIREALHRDLYRGAIVWGRKRKRDQWGQHRVTRRDEAEWIRRQDEGLRIVPEALWDAVHERLEGTRRAYLRGTEGQDSGDGPRMARSRATCSRGSPIADGAAARWRSARVTWAGVGGSSTPARPITAAGPACAATCWSSPSRWVTA